MADPARLLLTVFGGDRSRHHPPPERVRVLDCCAPSVRATFTEFAQHLHTSGFGFLHHRWRDGHLDGPILVTVTAGRIVGAIGPLRTMPDPRGYPVMLPQYFGVLPGHRGHGYGRALWRAAAAWADHHRAAYQLLQTQTGQAAEQLFLSEGLISLGFACSVSA